MCGFVFAVDASPVADLVEAMHADQHHRGPDGGRVHLETAGPHFLGFAHERLAIIDLSDRGAQPMVSASGRWLIAFNGEIYNYRALAAEHGLTGLSSGTDTEVALELIERFGIEEACRKFNGMWALAAYDRTEGKVHLSRDRFGKKPLHVARIDGAVYVASELTTLLRHPRLDRTPDATTAARFLGQSLQNVDTRTWLRDVRQIPGGSIVTVDVGDRALAVSEPRVFWEPEFSEVPERGDDDWIAHLRETVEDAVALRLHADVPVGIALSGGIDSSIIAAVAARRRRTLDQPVRLFSATSRGSKEDESAFVDIVARHLDIEVQSYDLDLDDSEAFLGALSTVMHHNDGPVSSFSPVLFYKLMGMARESGVTVVLTGQGADEAFCGYRKYPFFEIARRARSGNVLGAAALAAGFGLRGTLAQNFKFSEAKRYLGKSEQSTLGPAALEADAHVSLGGGRSLSKRQWDDIASLSVPYLCHYEDRMSMAWSREVRAPFLDYRVIESGLRMPTHLKLNSGWTKYALRRAFAEDLPPEITWRKDKKGFVNPQDDLLQGPLKDRVRALMGDPGAQVYAHGLVDREAFLALFDRYCAGDRRIWFREVFAPFSLAMWLESLKDGASA